ncbi:MAG: DivIVA domain-containing protein [Proteobacteria bacterium]|nr:DivIVA domain-containing protein [Pseudomonadota bacterium]MBU1059724.1 DivIVA domain-containing protein [Pseudomonadota bacterium]
MSITPQLIKDQEFQSKFRGFDPIEVKDYLETIADEFFTLQEQYKEQLAELESLRQEKETFVTYNSSLETDMQFTRKISEELKEGCSQKEEKIQELTKEIEELHLRIADIEQEQEEQEEEVSAAEARIKEAEEALKRVNEEKEDLAWKLALLKEQNDELRKEEVDFRSTLAAAQRFAEDLKAKSRVEAEEMIAAAHAEINTIREDAEAELERLPREIEALVRKRAEVKQELKEILETHLETLDAFYPEKQKKQSSAEDYDTELFERVEIGEDGLLHPEDMERLEMDLAGAILAGAVDEEALATLLGENREEGDALDLKQSVGLKGKEKNKGKGSP